MNAGGCMKQGKFRKVCIMKRGARRPGARKGNDKAGQNSARQMRGWAKQSNAEQSRGDLYGDLMVTVTWTKEAA